MSPDPEGEFHRGANGAQTLLFWASIIIHLVDVIFFNSNRASSFHVSMLIYLFLAIATFFVFKKDVKIDEDSKVPDFLQRMLRLPIFLALSFFWIALPFITGTFFGSTTVFAGITLFDIVSFIIVIFPLWPIYIGSKAEIKFVKLWISGWIITIVIIFIFSFASEIRTNAFLEYGGVPESYTFTPVFDLLVEEIFSGVTGWTKNIVSGGTRFGSKLINATGLNYYTGMVENTQDQPIGLYLDNVRTSDDYFYEGNDVNIWADIRGKSFNEEIIISPYCFIKGEVTGKTDPPRISILGEEHTTISCTLEGLKKDSYRAEVGVEFNFETWAYVTYTFVDNEFKRSLALQGKDVNRELDIDKRLEAVYTPGPVMLGMSSLIEQPVGIDLEKNNREPVIGVTLESVWSEDKGKIAKVSEFIISAPNDFEIIKCDRNITSKQTYDEEEYTDYYFNADDIDARSLYQSVTCRIHVKDPAGFLSSGQKVQRTFVARAKYIYALQKKVGVKVK
jgi:hypothetical protein